MQATLASAKSQMIAKISPASIVSVPVCDFGPCGARHTTIDQFSVSNFKFGSIHSNTNQIHSTAILAAFCVSVFLCAFTTPELLVILGCDCAVHT